MSLLVVNKKNRKKIHRVVLLKLKKRKHGKSFHDLSNVYKALFVDASYMGRVRQTRRYSPCVLILNQQALGNITLPV